MAASKAVIGRPPKYKSAEEIEEKIEAYFKECEGEVLRDDDGEPVLNKFGEPILIHQRPPTVTGLALALGFSTRLSLLNYQGKKEFVNTITRAKSRIEAYTEERLFDRDGTNGAQFSLRNNFSGWNDKTQSPLDEEEQKARIAQINAQTGILKAKVTSEENGGDGLSMLDPHDVVIPEFCEILDDTKHEHQIITSGRAGTKSSYAGVLAISTIVNDEPAAVIVLRKRHNKLRKTVYKEMIRAIGRLGMNKDDFDIGVSPMQIRYKKNNNVIYFSGSDSIDDTKGIIDEDKPIVIAILDELTEFFDIGEGEEELTNIEATFVRGNDNYFRMVYLYNPPKNPNAPINVWCKKMELRPDVLHKHVDYRDVPVSWIGKKLIESAELLKATDLRLYRWVWLGESIGVDDLIYYMFSDALVRESAAEVFKLIGIGVDYGQQNATTFQAAGVNINTRRIEGLAEFYHSGRDSGKQKSPSEYAQELINMTDALHEKYSCSAFYIYIDPSAKGLAEEIKRLARQSRPYAVSIRDAENNVKVGIQRVQKCMTYGVMSVSRNQGNLIREFGTYEYDKKSIEAGDEKPVKVDDHCCDAWRYLVMGLWSKIKYFMPESERGDE